MVAQPGKLSQGLPDGADFAARLSAVPQSRVTEVMAAVTQSLRSLVMDLRPSAAELRAAVDFLTEVGHHADARRQEWVLLADVLGLSSLIEDVNSPQGATPNTGPGPFYRADAPDLPNGATISRDGLGTPLQVSGRVTGLSGAGLGGAMVEVWQANAAGRYENQEPDLQPEFNLRGRFRTDGQGRFGYRSVMPKGYALPSGGPVGQLMARMGLPLDRPAHIHLRISAEGHEVLTTHIFDRADPAISRDAIFAVRPELLAEFRPASPDGAGRTLDLTLVLSPQGQPDRTKGEETSCR